MVQQLEPTTIDIDLDLLYPESDGKPLADNTLQFDLIVKIQGGISVLFADQPDIFVAGDLLWYPVEGIPISQAPDVMVAFGRPKGHRRSYKQWKEGNIAPQVVFEILSKSNTRQEMQEKLEFYDRYGVEEYYLYDPDKNLLKGWVRESIDRSKDIANQQMTPIAQMEGWTSPRLLSRFATRSGMLELYRPDGKKFESFVENAQRAEQETRRAEQETQRAEQELQARYSAIPRLLGLGLTIEQVAEALGFPIEEITNRSARIDK